MGAPLTVHDFLNDYDPNGTILGFWHRKLPRQLSQELVTPVEAGVQIGAPILGRGFRRDYALLSDVLATACYGTDISD